MPTSQPTSEQTKISAVTPTLYRPGEVEDLLKNLSQQVLLPFEVIIVDGSPLDGNATEKVVKSMSPALPFHCRYIKHARGTAIQRNAGIDVATGEFIAFIDDDVRLDPDFFQVIIRVFLKDEDRKVGGIVGYRRNKYFDPDTRQRWRWYRRLRLLTTYEPGRYDFQSGYPINVFMQKPFKGVRKVDFMTTACAVWRKEVFDSGLRLDPFFSGYGILEDAHFSLRARRRWDLLQCGDALCVELSSSRGREDRREIGYKCVVNYYYVFRDIVRPLTVPHQLRFWRYQVFELLRVGSSTIRRRRMSDATELLGRLRGFMAVAFGTYPGEGSARK
jgi:glycosyltransferase involved in cell wall biosynthesis